HHQVVHPFPPLRSSELLVRHLEIAVTGAAYRNCLTSAQAGALAEAARDRLGDGWILGRSGMAPSQSGTDCYRPVVALQFGAVYVLERRLFEIGRAHV